MRRLTCALILSALSILASTQAFADENSCAGPGPKGPDALDAALASTPTCKAAMAMLRQCAWGSSMDTTFGATVVSKCEQEFLGKLTPPDRRAYDRQMKLCADRYAHRDGTMYISATAICQADVATRFAAKQERVEAPSGQASFDCAKARTPLEKTICADPEVGRADLVLAERYTSALKGLEKGGSARSGLVASQNNWLKFVSRTCPLGAVGGTPSPAARACVLAAFTARSAQLETCRQQTGESHDRCINDFQDPRGDGKKAAR
ncbi:lysozyme inhibitor LprI family protein [Variovorax sp. VaC1]|uniref:lysozyme inhibitor LprI family protein n=1 Tax=Variovorax sp. VaC1 TaxID=3373132 RepID=UPI003747EC10